MVKVLKNLFKYLNKNIKAILVLISLCVAFYLYNSSFNKVENYIENYVDYNEANLGNIRVGKSEVAGRGVFANKKFAKGEVIEVCPLVEDKRSNISGVLGDYLFDSSKKGHSLLPFGYCAIVNHSFEPNAVWKVDNDKMVMLCLKDIKNGEEIFHSYGDGYWKTRKDLKRK